MKLYFCILIAIILAAGGLSLLAQDSAVSDSVAYEMAVGDSAKTAYFKDRINKDARYKLLFDLFRRVKQSEAWINQHVVTLEIVARDALPGARGIDLALTHSDGLTAVHAQPGVQFKGWQVGHNYIPGLTRIAAATATPDTIPAQSELVTIRFRQAGAFKPYNFSANATINEGAITTRLATRIWLEYRP